MNETKHCGGLDLFRTAAAVLVIANHTDPLLSVNSNANFFLTRVLARVAVPFFLMVTGQFVIAPCLFQGEQDFRRIFRCILKNTLLYATATLLYIPLNLYAGHFQGLTFTGFLRMLVFDGTFYHLWYFPACITGILLVCLLSRVLSFKGTMTAALFLYLAGLLGDSYYGLIENAPVLPDLYDFGFSLFSYTRNGLFLAPLFLMLGAAAGIRQSAGQPRKSFIGFLICFAVMTAEAFSLRHFGIPRHDSMYITLIPVMFFLYKSLLAADIRPVRKLRTVSMLIYVLHPAVIVLVRGAAKLLHAPLLTDNSLIYFLSVSILTILLSVGLTMLCSRIKEQKTGQPPARLSQNPAAHNTGRAWIELDRTALENNVRVLRAMLPDGCALMPAVKANAYGHGAVLIAKTLNRLHIKSFCVACASEGAELRRHGVKGEILVLGYTPPEQFPLLPRYRLSQTVVDFAYAVLLNDYGKRIHVHVGIDTGMHRLGERSEHTEQLCAIFEMKNLIIDGTFTHLCADDSTGAQERAFTELQAQSFFHAADELKRLGYACQKLHLLSSYGVINYPELGGDYARVGIALYGVLSTEEDTKTLGGALTPVLSLKARVSSVRDLYAGECAGYGMAFTATHDMKIAALAIGYADGLPRSLSDGGGYVLINGCKAPIIGRICMDQTIVDVTEVPDVKAGDTAVVIGRSGDREISVCDIAQRTGTITNEILSRLGTRLERIVI